MTFAPIPNEFKEAMEKEMQERFENWWDSWIEPLIACADQKMNGVDLPLGIKG